MKVSKVYLLSFALFGALSFDLSNALLFGAPPAADATEEIEESGDAEGEPAPPKPERIVILEPKKLVDPEVVAAETEKYLELGESFWDGGDIALAEQYFAAALGLPGRSPEKENVLWRMGQLYRDAGKYPNAIAILERLAEEYPNSRRLPLVFMELGGVYRKMGGMELAIAQYLESLNAMLNVSIDQVEKYRPLSRQVKLEIAKTHAELLDYEEAYRQYELLSRLELEPVELMRVRYRMCNLLYEMGDYHQAVPQLKDFLEAYEFSPHSPEMRYLLAKSYEQLNRKPDALREVVLILQRQSSPDTALEGDADYWKQRMGNELANEFYKQGDYRSALTIYQSLAKYNAEPVWRWPAIHQIGLCFERLGLPEKAIMAYEEILNLEDGALESLSPGLESMREMAKWRLEHLKWEDDLGARLAVLGAR
ncbi:MAG: hypothetical protein CBD18_05395 [Opitutales bacterium TMED158]|nr:MAG: hypothetical protein CBD18_05395 [Opitutales bacterium TMED158]